MTTPTQTTAAPVAPSVAAQTAPSVAPPVQSVTNPSFSFQTTPFTSAAGPISVAQPSNNKKLRFLQVSTHAHQFTGYSKVSYEIIKQLSLIPWLEVTHFGFQKHPQIPPNFRPYPSNISVLDAAEMEKPPQQGFGYSHLVEVIRAKKPHVVMIYNDMAVVSRFLEEIRKSGIVRTFKVCKMVSEQRIRTCEYKVCKMVAEHQVRTCEYKVCTMVAEQHVKTCTSKVCKMVAEQCSREECYKVCTMVKEACTKQVPVCTTRPVHYTKTVDVVRMVPKKVAYTVTRCVPTTVCREVPCGE